MTESESLEFLNGCRELIKRCERRLILEYLNPKGSRVNESEIVVIGSKFPSENHFTVSMKILAVREGAKIGFSCKPGKEGTLDLNDIVLENWIFKISPEQFKSTRIGKKKEVQKIDNIPETMECLFNGFCKRLKYMPLYEYLQKKVKESKVFLRYEVSVTVGDAKDFPESECSAECSEEVCSIPCMNSMFSIKVNFLREINFKSLFPDMKSSQKADEVKSRTDTFMMNAPHCLVNDTLLNRLETLNKNHEDQMKESGDVLKLSQSIIGFRGYKLERPTDVKDSGRSSDTEAKSISSKDIATMPQEVWSALIESFNPEFHNYEMLSRK